MAVATIVLPHADGDITCNRINFDDYSSEYLAKLATSQVTVRVRHSKTKAGLDRHNVEVTRTVYATAEKAEYVRKVYIVMENPPDDSDVKDADAMADWLIASADAKLVALKGWQSEF